MHSDTKNYIAGLRAGDGIVRGLINNIAGENSSAVVIARAMLRQVRREIKGAIDAEKGKSDAKM